MTAQALAESITDHAFKQGANPNDLLAAVEIIIDAAESAVDEYAREQGIGATAPTAAPTIDDDVEYLLNCSPAGTTEPPSVEHLARVAAVWKRRAENAEYLLTK